jgi:hypothetical protein
VTLNINNTIKSLFTALIVLFAPALMAQTLYSVTSGDDQLRRINPADAATLSVTTMTLAGQTISGATGAATHPASNQLWVLLKATGGSGRLLGTVNVGTGVVTAIGYTGEKFAGISFNEDGSILYGVTGDGSSTPESLFSLSQATGAAVLLTALGNGDDGEAIAVYPPDGLIYHASGHDGSDVIFEKINPNTFAITDIPLAGNALEDEEAQALVPIVGGFLWKQDHDDGPLYSVTTAGVPTLIGIMDHQAKGLAYVPAIFGAQEENAAVPVPTLGKVSLIALILSMLLLGSLAAARMKKASSTT